MAFQYNITIQKPSCIMLTVTLFLLLLLTPLAGAATPRLDALAILDPAYPRAFFFRQCEGMAAQQRNTYDRWDTTFNRLQGIIGKTLDEEVLGREARNPEFFTRFKKDHPNQLVLLHFNGNARDPRWHSGRFFPGHWLYFNGAIILSDIPAEPGETEIRVSDPRLFRTSTGRYRTSNEDIGLCELDVTGKPDWHKSEQVRLVSVDVRNKTIRVRRGCYDTKPRAFKADKSYAAAHMTEGPWGDKNNIMWFYNYSTQCPLDGNGYDCSDILADHLAELFGPTGKLAAFDGLEFDVLKHRPGFSSKLRSADCDADGKPDDGIIKNINTYGIGVVEFCRKLRNRLGDDRLILADGMAEQNQRAFTILNGIESEGWPHLRDFEITDWSGGLNRHFFWDQNSRAPVFNYINHKFNAPTGQPGVVKTADVPFSTHRLVFAVAAFTNSALCFSYAAPTDPDGLFGVWDELRMGTANKLAWLGKPLSPAVHLAARHPNLLKGAANPITTNFASRFSGTGVELYHSRNSLQIRSIDPNAPQTTFRLSNIPCNGPDLFIKVTARAASMRRYPAEIARLMHVAIAARKGESTRPPRFMTFVGEQEFNSTFYFSNLTDKTVDLGPAQPLYMTSKTIDLEFTIEFAEPLWITSITAHAHPDAIYRLFEHGLVLANPAPNPYTFNLAKLWPNRKFRRIQGTSTQDPTTNNGAPVGNELTLKPKDAIFLVND